MSEGVIRQLFDYDGQSLYPKTKPAGFVSNTNDGNDGINAIGELIESQEPDQETVEFVYRVQETGDLKAWKLDSACLSEDLTVTNVVGSAKSSYPKGTRLEEIIRDMLTAPGQVYDVTVSSVTNTITITANGTQYTTNASIHGELGDTISVSAAFTFTDGKFNKPSGYLDTSFDLYNNIPANEGKFHNTYLDASCAPQSWELKKGSTVCASGNFTGNTATCPAQTLTVESGSTTYSFITHYSSSGSHPYKSDGTASNMHISASTFTRTLTIISNTLFDVIPHNPTTSETASSLSSKITIRDITNESSTFGIRELWTGHTVQFTIEALNYTDGSFGPATGWNNSSFNTLNPNTDFGCANDFVGFKFGSNSSIYTNNNPTSSYTTPNIAIPQSGLSFSIDASIHYLGSTMTPKKSNGDNSSVNISPGYLPVNSSLYIYEDAVPEYHAIDTSIYVMFEGDPTQYKDGDLIPFTEGNTIEGSIYLSYTNPYFSLTNPYASAGHGIGNYTQDISLSNCQWDHIKINNVYTPSTGDTRPQPFNNVTLGITNNIDGSIKYTTNGTALRKRSGLPYFYEGDTGLTRFAITLYCAPLTTERYWYAKNVFYMYVGNVAAASNVEGVFNALGVTDVGSGLRGTISEASYAESQYVTDIDSAYYFNSGYYGILIVPAGYNQVNYYPGGIGGTSEAFVYIKTVPYSDTDSTLYKIFKSGNNQLTIHTPINRIKLIK